MVGPSDHRRFASAVQDRTPGGGALFSGGDATGGTRASSRYLFKMSPLVTVPETVKPSEGITTLKKLPLPAAPPQR